MSALALLGPRPRLLAALIAVSLPLSALPRPATALAAPTGKLSSSDAASERKPIQTKADGLLEANDADGAASLLSEEAAEKADPVLYIDAAEAYKAAGVKNKSRIDLENGIEKARIGLDILYFLQDPRVDADWSPVEGSNVGSEISRGEKAIESLEQAIEDLTKKKEAPVAADDDSKERKRAPRDGRGLIATGAVFTVIGVAGLGMLGGGLAMSISAQKHVDGLNPSDPTFPEDVAADDKKGKLGNTLAYAGIPVAAVGLAAGIALLVVGVKKRKAYQAEHGSGDTSASIRVFPVTGRGYAGLSLAGRF